MRQYRREHLNEHVQSQLRYLKRLKIRCFQYYGGAYPKCACCGENTPEFLSLDHINGGGNSHRKKEKIVGNGIYRWLRKNNFPKGFQILCFNCNLAKGFYGKCSHQENN